MVLVGDPACYYTTNDFNIINFRDLKRVDKNRVSEFVLEMSSL